jgi:hypothetical protein
VIERGDSFAEAAREHATAVEPGRPETSGGVLGEGAALRCEFLARRVPSAPVRVLLVSAAGCDDRVERQPGVTEQRREDSAVVIRQTHAEGKGRR